MSETREPSRRSFLAAAGGAATVGLAGCLGGDDGGLNELTVAHMPIYPDLQWYVMEGEGYFSEIDAEITGREFTDGPSIVQAIGGGDIDVAMFGIVPAMIVIDRDIPAQVTAANIREPMGIMAEESFHETFEAEGGDAFATWAEENGGPLPVRHLPAGQRPGRAAPLLAPGDRRRPRVERERRDNRDQRRERRLAGDRQRRDRRHLDHGAGANDRPRGGLVRHDAPDGRADPPRPARGGHPDERRGPRLSARRAVRRAARPCHRLHRREPGRDRRARRVGDRDAG